jgi:hypothetical protein
LSFLFGGWAFSLVKIKIQRSEPKSWERVGENLKITTMEGYDLAEICLNGHVTTSIARSYPNFRKNFCDECGEKTIMKCPSCQADIKGDYHMENVIGDPIMRYRNFVIAVGNLVHGQRGELQQLKT